MGLFKKRRYYFTDSSFASDTIIADCSGWNRADYRSCQCDCVHRDGGACAGGIRVIVYHRHAAVDRWRDLCTHGFTVPEGRRAWQADLHLAEHRILCGSGHNHFIRQILKSLDEVGGNYERRGFAGAYAACDRTNQ